MILAFDDVEIDLEKSELRRSREIVDVEPRVFSLLSFLVDNHDRMISKDELIEKIWNGRVISESALSTGIKEARKAVGDSGNQQSVIKTIHGRGFRCVATVNRLPSKTQSAQQTSNIVLESASADAVAIASSTTTASSKSPPQHIDSADTSSILTHLNQGQPSIAVLPFRFFGVDEQIEPFADAIPAELIGALSKLRWLFVTARNSSFKFRQDDVDLSTVRQVLHVNYCLSGVVESIGNMLTVSVELADTRTSVVVWAERFTATLETILELRSELAGGVIAGLELHIPLNEANMVKAYSVQDLDAWAAFHLGLQHMYRFNKSDNQIAADLFKQAIAKDPDFARAYAGLSFTGFQNAFLSHDSDRYTNVELATTSAEKALALDPMDPFANYNMGRSRWLTGELDDSLPWLDRARQLSPNFAQGYYARAWVDTLSGRTEQARNNTEVAMTLSPLDPLYYAMLGATALSYIGEENAAEAVYYGERAARSPGAHYFITLIAATAYALSGDLEKAHEWKDRVLKIKPDFSTDDFLRAFPYTDSSARERMTSLMAELGF